MVDLVEAFTETTHLETLYLSTFIDFGEVYDCVEFVFPYHPPEVSYCVGHGALCCNVGTSKLVALEGETSTYYISLARQGQALAHIYVRGIDVV